jgi:hypothetical protein
LPHESRRLRASITPNSDQKTGPLIDQSHKITGLFWCRNQVHNIRFVSVCFRRGRAGLPPVGPYSADSSPLAIRLSREIPGLVSLRRRHGGRQERVTAPTVRLSLTAIPQLALSPTRHGSRTAKSGSRQPKFARHGLRKHPEAWFAVARLISQLNNLLEWADRPRLRAVGSATGSRLAFQWKAGPGARTR